MTAALIITGVLLLWYGGKELRSSNPNWPRAINTVIFWPLSLFFNLSSKEKNKA